MNDEKLQPLRRVRWHGLNRDYEGYLVGPAPHGWLVRLRGSNKCIILNNKSKWEKP